MIAPVNDGAPLSMQRITAFDGLRGVAALIVVIFHFLCLLYPRMTPEMSDVPVAIAHTPMHIFWNGLFAVAVFFVLSGFVMAAAADRRRSFLLSNSVTRYFRLAVPAVLSCVMAWMWLSFWPTAAETMADTVEAPSRWLQYTYQGEVKTVGHAVADGAVANFWRGYSRFNNVLWTLQYELVGSLAIFVGYWLSAGRARLLLLLLSSIAIILFIPGPYLAFPLGAALYEARIRGVLDKIPAAVPVLALIGGILLGYPGAGSHERLGLPPVPDQWELGASRGMIPVLAAGLLVYAAFTLHSISRFFSHAVPVWLGRISFSLYLVHVPPLYTVVAWSHAQHDVHPALLATGYFIGVFAIAHVFTLLVDEPVMQCLPKLRARIGDANARLCEVRMRRKAATRNAS